MPSATEPVCEGCIRQSVEFPGEFDAGGVVAPAAGVVEQHVKCITAHFRIALEAFGQCATGVAFAAVVGAELDFREFELPLRIVRREPHGHREMLLRSGQHRFSSRQAWAAVE